MDEIKFVPRSQKNIETLLNQNSKSKGWFIFYFLFFLFFVYCVVAGGGYWFFIVKEQFNVTKKIQALDSSNQNYYPSSDLNQSLFNVSNLVETYYNPTDVISSIESNYVAGSKVLSVSYNKINKIINISMVSPSINDITSQIGKFNALPLIESSSFSTVSADKDNNGFAFTVEIKLK
jgi:hypothetical protein